MRFSESVLEEASLAWLVDVGWRGLLGPAQAANARGAERSDTGYQDVPLERRLRQTLKRLNPDLSREALDDAHRRLRRVDTGILVERNRGAHRMLVDGVTVEYRRPDGSIGGAQARVIDFDEPGNNDWLAVNQFTVVEGQHEQRPDVVVFVNGLPLAVLELKNPADEEATVWTAWKQLQTYQAQIPEVLTHSVCTIAVEAVPTGDWVVKTGKERLDQDSDSEAMREAS